MRINDLPKAEQQWLAQAVASILMADGLADSNEMQFLKKLSQIFSVEQPLSLLKSLSPVIRGQAPAQVEKIKVANLDHLVFMLDVLAAAVFANGKKLHSETEKYFEAGRKLGVNIGTLSYRLSLEAEKFRVNRKLRQIRKDIKEDLLRTLQVE